MYNNKNDVRKCVDYFCNRKNIDKSIFEVSSFSSAMGGKKERLNNNTKVKNKNCVYVIKYYFKLNLFVVWNYKANTSMSYSLKTIKNKLSKGVMFADKGSGFHTINQALIYFAYENDFEKLLNLITNQI